MATKHDLLTDDEMLTYPLRPIIAEAVATAARTLGRPLPDIRVLDWECGRGRLVGKLRQAGVQAYGVDGDPGPIEKGLPWFRAHGFDGDTPLSCLDGQGRAPFPDSAFDVVVTTEVLEHVSDLDAVLRELSRLTRSGGLSLHQLPAHLLVVEPHLGMPLIHWLPKSSAARERLIRAYVRTGLNPRGWSDVHDDAPTRIETFAAYSRQHTFYRPWWELRACFERHGFDVRFAPPPFNDEPTRRSAAWRDGARAIKKVLRRTFREICFATRRT